MAALAQQPLLPLTKKQRGMIGEERVRESQRAQIRARGLFEMPAQRAYTDQMSYFPSKMHSVGDISASEWATWAVDDVALITRKVGNHVCRPDVCLKGRVGKKGFAACSIGTGLVKWAERETSLRR